MNVYQKDFSVSTKKRSEMVDITSTVNSIVKDSGVTDGEVTVYCPHTTAGITINENADPSVPHDVLLTLSELIPQHRTGYQHSEGNSDSHCKSSLIGCSEHALVQNGSLDLGTWQAIFFCEFDGPRRRNVLVQVRGL
ncbi:MAG: secondary thiamine-phosphate synthase enzyme YjbQ [Planctomycetota bacterium]|jgi:secondary thiamine-phosphate synthase enzyme